MRGKADGPLPLHIGVTPPAQEGGDLALGDNSVLARNHERLAVVPLTIGRALQSKR